IEANLQLFNTLLSRNQISNHKLTEVQQVAIITAVLTGTSYREAARLFNCSYRAVTKTLQRFRNNHTFQSLPQKGPPEKLSKRKKKAIVRSTRRNFRQTYQELAKE
ncbi:uncharacterized protein LY79DRAFT_531940, partial [Colletotrichum navitas]